MTRPARDAMDLQAARQRRARWVGGSLFLCVLVAAVAVALNDLRVRREAGERYVQALVDSHARQLGHEIDNIQRAFQGVADGLAAMREVAPEAAPTLAREAIAGIAASNRRLGGLRVEPAMPEFVSPDMTTPRRLHIGRPGPGPDGRWGIPLAMQLEAGPGDPLWLRAEMDAEVFSEVLRAHEVGEDGVASVLTRDAMLIARSDSGTRHAGLDARA